MEHEIGDVTEQQPTSAVSLTATDSKSAALSNGDVAASDPKPVDLPRETGGKVRVKRYSRPSVEEVKRLEGEKSAELEQIKRQLSLSAGARQQVRAIRDRHQAEFQAAKTALHKAQERWRELLDRKRALQERFRESANTPGAKTTTTSFGARKYRSVADVDARIEELEEAQAHSTLSLSEEKRMIAELSYLRIHAREEAKAAEREQESRREQREVIRRKREDLESERRKLEEEISEARKELDRQREQLDQLRKSVDEQVDKARAAATPIDRDALQKRFTELRQEIQALWDTHREAERKWRENERLWWEQERQARQERREAEAARRREQWKQREMARLLEEPVDPYLEKRQACDLVLRALLTMLPADAAIRADIQTALAGTSASLSMKASSLEDSTRSAAVSNGNPTEAIDAAGVARIGTASLTGFRPVGKTATKQDGIDQLYAKKVSRGRTARVDRASVKHGIGHGPGPSRRQANTMNFSAEQILAFHTCGVGVPAAPTEIEATAVQALATRKKLEQESLVFLEGERIRRQARIDALEKGLEQPDQNEPEFGSGGDANSAAESSMRNVDQECEIAVESPNAVSPLHEPAEYQARTVAGKVVALERDSTPIVPNTLGVNHEGATKNNTMEMAGSSNRHALSDDDFLALRTADGHLVRTSNGPTVQGVWASRATISPVRNGAPEAESMLASRAPGTTWSKIFPDQRHSASASTEIPQLKSTETLDHVAASVRAPTSQ